MGGDQILAARQFLQTLQAQQLGFFHVQDLALVDQPLLLLPQRFDAIAGEQIGHARRQRDQ